jgi:hypothetical protein
VSVIGEKVVAINEGVESNGYKTVGKYYFVNLGAFKKSVVVYEFCITVNRAGFDLGIRSSDKHGIGCIVRTEIKSVIEIKGSVMINASNIKYIRINIGSTVEFLDPNADGANGTTNAGSASV